MDDLYSEIIVDHYKNPRNFGDLENPTHRKRGSNASCGDMLEFYAKIPEARSKKQEARIENISFKGIGCAMSTAAASMLTERIKNQELRIKDVQEMTLEDVVEMMGIEISPTRMKCVGLALRTLQEMLEEENG